MDNFIEKNRFWPKKRQINVFWGFQFLLHENTEQFSCAARIMLKPK